MAKSETITADALPVVRTRDADRTRASLLKAGLREFAENGFGGARLERVVKGARCNIRMVYHYFGGKEGLYLAVLEAASEQMRRQEATLSVDLDRPLVGILELMRFSYEFFERNPLVEALFRAEDHTPSTRAARLSPMARSLESRLRLIADLIASGQAKGLFREDLDPLQVHVTMAALSCFRLGNSQSQAVAMMSTGMVPNGGRAWREQRLQHCLDFLEGGLLNTRVKKRPVMGARFVPPPGRGFAQPSAAGRTAA